MKKGAKTATLCNEMQHSGQLIIVAAVSGVAVAGNRSESVFAVACGLDSSTRWA
jgi:hypothetical protein